MIEGTLVKYNPLFLPLLSPQLTIKHKTIFFQRMSSQFVYCICTRIWQHSNGCQDFDHVKENHLNTGYMCNIPFQQMRHDSYLFIFTQRGQVLQDESLLHAKGQRIKGERHWKNVVAFLAWADPPAGRYTL